MGFLYLFRPWSKYAKTHLDFRESLRQDYKKHYKICSVFYLQKCYNKNGGTSEVSLLGYSQVGGC